ncbi:MAG: TRAP transporter substrate-binding protein [Clostridia bacterium]|nr:TRAP transporter substrate-binding protein [Candidatus Pelethousia sp.]NCB30640.1 TRAP transporter substrate-binding protein [Clostridia bacterium]
MKKYIALLLTFLVTVSMVAGCAAPSQPAAQAPAAQEPAATEAQAAEPAAASEPAYVLKIGHDHTTTSPIQASAEEFKRLVEENSNGQISVEIYPAQQLGSSREMIESLQIGTLEAVLLPTAKFGGFDQRLNLADMPFIADSEKDFLTIFNGEIGQEAMSGLPSIGITGIAYYPEGFKAITNNVHPIVTPADLKGLKIRTMEAPIIMSMFSAWGANPVPVDFTEVYNSLQQNVVDGQENPFLSIHDMKFYEVQKYMTISNHAYLSYFLAASTSWFDALPADLQEVVRQAGIDASAFCLVKMNEANDGYLKTIKDYGVEVYELSQEERQTFKDACSSVYDDYRDVIGGDLLDRAVAQAAELSAAQ